MTDKISFLKFFFDSGKYAEPAYSGSIMDFYPAVAFVYHVGYPRIRYINRSFTSYFGLTYIDICEDENILTTLVFREDVPRFKNALELGSMPGSGDIFTFTSRLNHKEGEGNPFRIQATILKRTPEGKADVILFVAQDSTDEEKSKEEIDALKNLSAETEEMFHFGTWTLSIHDHTMTWTAGLLNLFGYRPGELPGPLQMNFYLDHVVNGYKDALAEIIDQAIYTRTDFECEYVVQTRDTTQKTVFTKGKLIRDSAGNVEKIVGITRDITALRNSEIAHERHIRQLNKSNKELEEFAYIASHDLQEPLRKIAMFGERLRLKFGNSLDEEGELFLSRIQASSASMKALIDNLLEFSRANRSSNNFSMLDLRTLFDQAIGDLELKIEETQTKIEVKGVLPRIEAVPSEMKQLFTNLLSNSIKFRKETSPSSVEVSVRKLTKDEKRAYHLQVLRTFYKIDVRDNGVGFEEEYSDKIFQIFQRLHGKTEYPGCGIGLAICKKIIENHKGLIFAHSVPNEGATFTVILPEKQF
jgi:signal transduction histidine kinase